MTAAFEPRLMLRSSVSLLLLTLSLTGNIAAQTNQASTYQDQYLVVYVRMHDAENLEKEGDLKTALSEYLDCQKRLTAMAKVDPDLSLPLSGLAVKTNQLKTKIAETQPQSSSLPH
jgi:hypothetical protein